jgi:AcrR family transcriptional regulator
VGKTFFPKKVFPTNPKPSHFFAFPIFPPFFKEAQLATAVLEEIRRSQILEAGLVTIAQKGAAATTMEEIARAAGLSKGGLAYYFKSKDALHKAVFKEFFDQVFALCRQQMEAYDDPMDKLLSFQLLFDFEHEYAPMGYPLLFDFMSVAVRNSEYRKMFSEWVNNWISLLMEAIETGIARGQFEGVNPEPVARTISAIYQGVATRWYLAPDEHSRQWAWDAVCQSVRSLMAPYQQQAKAEAI